jgi:hypothetical protein
MFEYKFDNNSFGLNGSERFFFTINTSLDRTIDPKEMFAGIKLGTDPILEVRNIDNAVAQVLDVHAIYKYVLEVHNGNARILK